MKLNFKISKQNRFCSVKPVQHSYPSHTRISSSQIPVHFEQNAGATRKTRVYPSAQTSLHQGNNPWHRARLRVSTPISRALLRVICLLPQPVATDTTTSSCMCTAGNAADGRCYGHQQIDVHPPKHHQYPEFGKNSKRKFEHLDPTTQRHVTRKKRLALPPLAMRGVEIPAKPSSSHLLPSP